MSVEWKIISRIGLTEGGGCRQAADLSCAAGLGDDHVGNPGGQQFRGNVIAELGHPLGGGCRHVWAVGNDGNNQLHAFLLTEVVQRTETVDPFTAGLVAPLVFPGHRSGKPIRLLDGSL